MCVRVLIYKHYNQFTSFSKFAKNFVIECRPNIIFQFPTVSNNNMAEARTFQAVALVSPIFFFTPGMAYGIDIWEILDFNEDSVFDGRKLRKSATSTGNLLGRWSAVNT